MKKKVDYVLGQGQTREHTCHWPGCTAQVPPAVWGCRLHWYALPLGLRNRLWRAYVIGQEKTMNPTAEYIAAAKAIQEWIKNNSGDHYTYSKGSRP